MILQPANEDVGLLGTQRIAASNGGEPCQVKACVPSCFRQWKAF